MAVLPFSGVKSVLSHEDDQLEAEHHHHNHHHHHYYYIHHLETEHVGWRKVHAALSAWPQVSENWNIF